MIEAIRYAYIYSFNWSSPNKCLLAAYDVPITVRRRLQRPSPWPHKAYRLLRCDPGQTRKTD